MFERFWPADLHVIGKNITRFHCLYWPAMLMSAGLPLPRQVFAHGFMLLRGEKMSKTRGNVLDPDSAVDLFGVDGIRYLVLREIPFDRDADITLEGLVRRYNADLANDLGNLLNRTVSMANRYLDGQLPALAQTDAEADVDLRAAAARAWDGYRDAMQRQHLDEALAAMIDLVRAGNGYAESQAPWCWPRRGTASAWGRCWPPWPRRAASWATWWRPSLPRQRGGSTSSWAWPTTGGQRLAEAAAWGGGTDGLQVGEPVPLFPRVELPDEAAVEVPS